MTPQIKNEDKEGNRQTSYPIPVTLNSLSNGHIYLP